MPTLVTAFGRAFGPFRLRSLGRGMGAVAVVLILSVVLGPILSVLWLALTPEENIWPHLAATVLPRYLMRSLQLMAGVGLLCALTGTAVAWLVVMYRFPGRAWIEHALLFPLAVPAYVGAYALVDFLDYAGPLQVGLRAAMGWRDARDYWFPQVRALWPAIITLSAALYPYVYLMARNAFREQSGAVYEVGRALGCGPWAMFWRVGVPLARPAVAAGVALVLMETAADYGTVAHFGVQTLTTGIFSTWLGANNAGGAAQIAGVVMALVLALVLIERLSRRNARFFRPARAVRPVLAQPLRGLRGWLATGICLVPVLVGFVLPVAVMALHAVRKPGVWTAPGLSRAVGNTLWVGGVAAVMTVSAAVLLVYLLRTTQAARAPLILPLTAMGYAAPGAVLAVGLLVPLAALDHRLADAILALTGQDPGLLLTGSSVAVILACFVRFFAVAQNAADAAMGRVSPSLSMAARSLGRGPMGVLRSVFLPLMRGSVVTAWLLVFVDCVKELPATLLLRPFNFDTLATRTFELASLEKLGEAAPAALIVMAVGLAAVGLLARANRGT